MTQQKRSSAPKPELDRRQLILRLLVDEKDFQKRLSKTVISRRANPAGLDTLISALGQLGFDVASATREVDGPALRHCMRCHVEYDPRDNPNDACKIRHDQTVEADLVSPTYKHGSVMYFGCCEQKLDLEYIEDHLEPERVGTWCIQARHTPNPEDVDYDHPEIEDCETKGCSEEEDESDDAEDDEESDVAKSDDSVQIVDTNSPPRKRMRRGD